MLFKSKEAKTREIMLKGIYTGLIEAAYVVLVCVFVTSAGAIFPAKSAFAILGIAGMMMLLVISVAVSALLVFGAPVYFMLHKKYREAAIFVGANILALLVVFAVFMAFAIAF